MDDEATNTMKRLLSWWRNPNTDRSDLFTDDFAFDSGVPGYDFFQWLVEQAPPWEDVAVLEMLAVNNRGCLVFEGFDPVTGLTHRVCWIIYVENHRVTKIVETAATISSRK